jgi:SPP1 family predicted phage head-tail adaptor
MRAGRLDRTIVVERATSAVAADGTPTLTWSPVATLRAEVVEGGTTEFIREGGAGDETAIVFRTRWLDGITDADRVVYGGMVFGITEVKEIGRRRGLEIRCVARSA